MYMLDLDELDKQILAILRANARTPLSEIAKRINRSRTAVQARLDKLENSGAILGFTIRQPGDESSKASAMVTVYLHERLAPEAVVALLKSFPEVRQCYRISGEADLMVELARAPHERIQEICKDLWSHENVRLTDTVFVMESLLNS